MFKYTRISNISCVNMADGSRAFVSCILIADPLEEGANGLLDNRQLRTFTPGGLPAVSYWLDPQKDIEIQPVAGGHFIVLGESGDYNLDAGVRIKFTDQYGKEIVLVAHTQNHNHPVAIDHLEVESVETRYMNERAIEFWQAPNYPVVIHQRKEDALELIERLDRAPWGVAP